MTIQTPPTAGETAAAQDRRFGLRVPRDGTPAPFRVLIGWRWLLAGVAAGAALLSAGIRLPQHRRWSTLIGSVSAAALGLLGVAVGAARRPAFERIELPIPDLPPALDGFTIAQISDMHLGLPFTHANLQRAAAWVAKQQPDMIALTGDFVDELRNLPGLLPSLRTLRAPYGLFAVLGNHDYWAGSEPLVAALKACGVDVLRNERRILRVGDATLVVAGLDCIWMKRHDIATTLDAVPSRATVVVLAHEPDIADEVVQHDVALQLSGHTHAGHIALPILGPMFLPRHGFRYFRGLQRVGSMWLYVTRGIGGLPLRIGGPPEVTLHVLRR